MSTIGKTIQSKSGLERNKRIWILKTGEKIIDKFRSKAVAENYKKYYENKYSTKVTLERDNSLKLKFKESIKK